MDVCTDAARCAEFQHGRIDLPHPGLVVPAQPSHGASIPFRCHLVMAHIHRFLLWLS